MNQVGSVYIPTLFILCLLFFSSCGERKKQKISWVEGQGTATDQGSEDLNAHYLVLERQRNALQYELQWLGARAKVARAEMELNLALSAEKRLMTEIRRFSDKNQGFANSDELQSKQYQISWDAKLEARGKEVTKARAQVNLFSRELNELRFEISKNGFSSPAKGLVK
tara:strand:+ start:112 stop:615 length:504 start_codon:yes stop_codon:yes gene_type:complete